MVVGNTDALPLIRLCGIRKQYGGKNGEPAVEVLHGIDLEIHAGEFVALVGSSGSGKSTLMHILGCLDRPSLGTYYFAGQDIASLNADQLAWLRREAFGFVFQGYHLIPTLDVLHNVQVPALYAGTPARERQAQATMLLNRLGLENRAGYQPNQLSGGQQQRVSIARALINGGHVILADEPTGALDSHSGAEVMALLRELADVGHTIILITHDLQVASQARRVVRISDGRIVDDTAQNTESGREFDSILEGVSMPAVTAPSLDAHAFMTRMVQGVSHNASWLTDASEALSSAWRTLWVNRFRTVLTLLGIVIGVASMIVLTAVGQATSEKALRQMETFGGVHRMSIWGSIDSTTGIQGNISYADIGQVQSVRNIRLTSPFLTAGGVLLRAGNVVLAANVWSVSAQALEIFNWKVARGIFFTEEDENNLATVAVLGKRTKEHLFGLETDAVGQYILINQVPFRVIGELTEIGTDSGNSSDDDMVVLPFSTGSRRVAGVINPAGIQLLIESLDTIDQTVQDITATLQEARGVNDFRIANNPGRIKEQQEAERDQALLLALIAGISLVVGGIGVMNIMLMAVKERTREIGIRMATGARQRDIQRQFVAESIMVSLVGGVVGVVIGLLIGVALILWDVPVIFSIRAMLLAFSCAVATGLIFGLMPAHQAARLDPVVALARE